MVLVVFVVLHTQPQRDLAALLRTNEVFTPFEEVQYLGSPKALAVKAVAKLGVVLDARLLDLAS